jgi:hypothetical protein
LKIDGKSNIHHFDIGYEALWDKSETLNVTKCFAKINQLSKEIKYLNINNLIYSNEGFLSSEIVDEINSLKAERKIIIDNFETQLERKFNDQTTHGFNPLEVNRQEDRVVASGMGRIAEFVVGESTQFFNHYSAGTGTTPVYASDTTLIEELVRVSIEQQGYATASGAVIKYGAYFPPGVQTATITEAGVFDQMVGGVMLFRTVYPLEKVINHVQSITFFTLSHAIYQSSI